MEKIAQHESRPNMKELLYQLESLPDNAIKQVADFIAFLHYRYGKNSHTQHADLLNLRR
jgi:hypothetical protein